MHTTSGGRVAWQSTSDGENSYSHWAAQQLRGRSRRARSRRADAPGWRAERLPGDDPEMVARRQCSSRRCRNFGWTEGHNMRFDYRWTRSSERLQKCGGTGRARARRHSRVGNLRRAVQQATRTIPIVFNAAIDPVGAGFVESLARPGGNITGFTQFEYGLAGKWLELLKEIAPRASRVAIVCDPTSSPGSASLPRSRRWPRRSGWSCAHQRERYGRKPD